MYYIKNRLGEYIRRDSSGKFVRAHNICMADAYEEEWKAKRVLSNCLKPKERRAFRVVYREENDIAKKEEVKAVTPVREESKRLEALNSIELPEIARDRISEWKERLREVKSFELDSKTRRAELTEQLSDVDLEISDCQHYIELKDDLTDEEMVAMYKLMKSRLEKRRVIKDELLILRGIGEVSIDVAALDDIIDMITRMESRVYAPRKLFELFA